MILGLTNDFRMKYISVIILAEIARCSFASGGSYYGFDKVKAGPLLDLETPSLLHPVLFVGLSLQ